MAINEIASPGFAGLAMTVGSEFVTMAAHSTGEKTFPMRTIKIACSGFPVGQKMYRSRLGAVELSQMFDGLPRTKTVERWRSEASDRFEFISCVPEDVSHLQSETVKRGSHRLGSFQDTPEVHASFRKTVMTATALRSRLLFLKLSRTLGPQADNVNRIVQFFKKADRGTLTVVWEPPQNWPASIVSGVSKTLRLVTAVNPLSAPQGAHAGGVKYFRLGAGGRTGGIHSFTDPELQKIKAACDGTVNYVVFNSGPRSFDDAVRFASLIY